MNKHCQFLLKNSSVQATTKEDKIIIENCWEDNTFFFEFSSAEPLDFLEHVILPPELFAIYHSDLKMYEFIFAPLQNHYNRDFTYCYNGKEYHLYYGKPTDVFVNLVQHFVLNNQEDTNHRTYGLLRYYSYYTSDDDDKKKIIPTNFFIRGEFDEGNFEKDLEFFNHVNFMFKFYDRKSPTILIFDRKDEYNLTDIKVPCKSANNKFPTLLKSNIFDSTLLNLIDTANETSNDRLRYIFYFQVLEYCSYYYIESELKRRVTNIIKSPDILNAEKYSNRIIEIYSDYFKSNKDERRMERLLTDLCDYNDIKDEIKTNASYFVKELKFDGGFTIGGLFNTEQEIDTPPKEIMCQIRKNLDAIRNVLVHARESRENSVIKPTNKNNYLLKPYLFLLRRIAEIVVIKYPD